MVRKILVYGHGDKSKAGFEGEADLVRYLRGALFSDYRGRYQTTNGKEADVIVVSRDGYAYGHLEVRPPAERPDERDLREYPRTRWVYVIARSFHYNKKVRLKDVGVIRFKFGKYLSEDEFTEIQRLSEGNEESSG